MVDYSQLKVYVLAPRVTSTDANIEYYYDFSQSIAEYEKVFSDLKMQWQWQPVSMGNFKEIISDIISEHTDLPIQPLFLNLCDGDELNDTPGVSVIQFLKQHNALFTGADEYFYKITTSKELMKQAFDAHHVANAAWQFITSVSDIDENIFDKIGSPIIVKPAISGGSMGVGIKNVVHTMDELKEQVGRMLDGYRGWNLNAGGIVAEQFIAGPEYTVLITGNYNQPDTLKVYAPVERVFHTSLKEEEKFLSFDRLWEIYEDEAPMPNNENFYEYALANASLIEGLQQISLQAYTACKGKSYTRVDVRMDSITKKLYVLEVNAQCGLSEDEDYTSIGAILKFSNKSFSSLIKDIINNSFAKVELPV